jgi:hypothetical protein
VLSIVWIWNRNRNLNLSKVGTGTATNYRYSLPVLNVLWLPYLLISFFCEQFLLAWIRIPKSGYDPLTRLNPDPLTLDLIRIRNIADWSRLRTPVRHSRHQRYGTLSTQHSTKGHLVQVPYRLDKAPANINDVLRDEGGREVK